jgi:putative transposase
VENPAPQFITLFPASAVQRTGATSVRQITDEWLERYNEIRPHDALGSLPPARYRERLLAAQDSTSELST